MRSTETSVAIAASTDRSISARSPMMPEENSEQAGHDDAGQAAYCQHGHPGIDRHRPGELFSRAAAALLQIGFISGPPGMGKIWTSTDQEGASARSGRRD